MARDRSIRGDKYSRRFMDKPPRVELTRIPERVKQYESLPGQKPLIADDAGTYDEPKPKPKRRRKGTSN